jgi:predicted CoA-substrate-specific enzyme activase
LERLAAEVDGVSTRVGITGMGRHLLEARCPDAVPANEVVASARGAAALCPEARSAIEIGGKTSRWVALHPDGSGDVVDFALSDLCAAGAGSFLEQQAGRLKLTVPELAELATRAHRGATVAGRCAVFAKSDMIHLQQKGTPSSEIAYGLCLALARNFQARVLRGRPLVPPVALLGGCTANTGLVHALREVLELDDDTAILPEDSPWAGAVGAGLLAEEGQPGAGPCRKSGPPTTPLPDCPPSPHRVSANRPPSPTAS